MISSDDLQRMVIEITTGKIPTLNTPEATVMRAQLQAECEAIRAMGGEVIVPFEVPDLDEE